jgi:hypothetical protein
MLCLLPADGKTVVKISNLTDRVFEIFGITQADLKVPINDNTASAVAAGREIVGNGIDGYCAMHKLELITGHAVGIKKRSRKKVIFDSFPEAEEIWKAFKKMVGWLLSGHNKHRFVTYRKLLQRNIMLELCRWMSRTLHVLVVGVRCMSNVVETGGPW